MQLVKGMTVLEYAKQYRKKYYPLHKKHIIAYQTNYNRTIYKEKHYKHVANYQAKYRECLVMYQQLKYWAKKDNRW